MRYSNNPLTKRVQANSFCQYLEWDSQFFGYRIAQATIARLNQETIQSILVWCQAHRIDCLYFLADSDDQATVRLMEQHQFRLVDIRFTLERGLKQRLGRKTECEQVLVRPWKPEDLPALQAVARLSHCDSRFYYDSQFPRSLCDGLYEEWLRKSCEGYADAVLVAECAGQAVGYVTLHIPSGTEGSIGLVGVSANFRGRGIASKLLFEALYWFRNCDLTTATVVTQGRNRQAQRLYQKSGFLTRSVNLWFHKWFSKNNSGEDNVLVSYSI